MKAMWVVICAIMVQWSASGSSTLAADLPVGEQIVFQLSANGSRSTRPFAVKDHWEIRWDSKDGVTISVMRADANPKTPLSKLPVAIGSQITPGAGSTYVELGGRYYLQITGFGDWSISVVQLP